MPGPLWKFLELFGRRFITAPSGYCRVRLHSNRAVRNPHDCRKHDITARVSDPMGRDGGPHRDRHVVRRGTGVTYPLLSFILERPGTSPGLIGLSAAMTPLGFIVSAPFTPALAGRVGGARLAILCSILAASPWSRLPGRRKSGPGCLCVSCSASSPIRLM